MPVWLKATNKCLHSADTVGEYFDAWLLIIYNPFIPVAMNTERMNEKKLMKNELLLNNCCRSEILVC